MKANKLYRIVRHNFRGNTGPEAGVIIKGDTVSINVYGSHTLPETIDDMVDIANNTLFEAAGAYNFSILPNYVCFYGTADSIEVVNYDESEELATF